MELFLEEYLKKLSESPTELTKKVTIQNLDKFVLFYFV